MPDPKRAQTQPLHSLPYQTTERERQLANALLSYDARLRDFAEELDETKSAALAALSVAGDCKLMLKTMLEAQAAKRRDTSSDPPSRSASPQPRSYNLSTTQTGSVKLDDVKEKLDELDDQVREARAREAGAKEALAAAESASKALRDRILVFIALATVVGGGLAWFLKSVFHI